MLLLLIMARGDIICARQVRTVVDGRPRLRQQPESSEMTPLWGKRYSKGAVVLYVSD
jgi:hypothetical protein